MLVQAITSPVPFSRRIGNVRCRHKPGNRLESESQTRILAQPSGSDPGQCPGKLQHPNFPDGIEPAAALAPLNVPIPHRWKDQQAHAEVFSSDAFPCDGMVRRCSECPEQQRKVLGLLQSGLLIPYPATIEADFGQGGGFEPQKLFHFLRELPRCCAGRGADLDLNVVDALTELTGT